MEGVPADLFQWILINHLVPIDAIQVCMASKTLYQKSGKLLRKMLYTNHLRHRFKLSVNTCYRDGIPFQWHSYLYSYRCACCNEYVKTWPKLKRHMKKESVCKFCNTSLPCKGSLRKHLNVCPYNEQFRCMLGPLSFCGHEIYCQHTTTRRQMKQHQTDEQHVMVCKHCDKAINIFKRYSLTQRGWVLREDPSEMCGYSQLKWVRLTEFCSSRNFRWKLQNAKK